MVEIGQRLIKNNSIDPGLKDEFNDWGKTIVETFLKDEKAQANAGAKTNAWIAYFKAQLSTRREWKYEPKTNSRAKGSGLDRYSQPHGSGFKKITPAKNSCSLAEDCSGKQPVQ